MTLYNYTKKYEENKNMLNKTSLSLYSLNKRRKTINTSPDYQRPSVWTTSQKQLLIDSILKDYDIPKIYLHQKDDGCIDVVDGQQRIRTIWDFYDNKFAIPKDADKINGIDIANKKYCDLAPDISDIIDSYNLDIVILNNENEDEIREMFLRLQNGTSLKAQEKRNAIPSKMRDFVKKITSHNFFTKVGFKNSRFTYDLIAAQMCLLAINKKICNIKDKDLNEMYWNNASFDEKCADAKMVYKILDYLDTMFEAKAPELKRHSVISLFILIMDMMPNYDIRNREKDLYNWFIALEQRRLLDEQKPPEEQDPRFVIYHEKTSNSSDAADSLTYRHNFLKESLLAAVPNLPLKDVKRNFDEAQRQVIYRRDNGQCKICGKKCEWNEWEADHITPWSKGGQTTIENGQVLCPTCNAQKKDN